MESGISSSSCLTLQQAIRLNPNHRLQLQGYSVLIQINRWSARGTSALGHKRTYAAHKPMSALPPITTAKADIRWWIGEANACRHSGAVCDASSFIPMNASIAGV